MIADVLTHGDKRDRGDSDQGCEIRCVIPEDDLKLRHRKPARLINCCKVHETEHNSHNVTHSDPHQEGNDLQKAAGGSHHNRCDDEGDKCHDDNPDLHLCSPGKSDLADR